ncbi:MAG: uroporphyrinogen-III synthase [Bacteroidota bacterium]|nr:uroporphyrinogen-III synthase [Bacteroidota bacterium]
MKIKSILVTQPQPSELEKSPYRDLAKKFNLDVSFRQFIKIEGVPAKEFRKDRINPMDFTAVIFTSRNAVDHYFRICKEMRIEVPDTMKYFNISESTAYYLQKYVQYRKRKIFYSKDNFENLSELIKKHKSEKFLLPCSDIHNPEMAKMLDDNKILYKKAIIYRTVSCDLTDMKINQFDMMVFFSPAGIKALYKNFPKYKQNNTIIGAFGPATAKAATDAGLTLNISAPSKEAPSMTMAIDQFIQAELKKK